MARLISCLVLFLLLSSCGKDRMFFEKKEVSPEGWPYSQEIQFQVEVEDTTGAYDLELHIEHDRSYSYQNTYLNIVTEFPDGEKTEQVLSIELVDDFGQWIGNCKGTDCEAVVDLIKRISFQLPGNYGFLISQHSREESLKGVKSISLGVTKSK